MKRTLYAAFVIVWVTLFVMTGWTSSVASTMHSSNCTRTETFQDLQIPYVSGVVHARTFAFLYESGPASAWFNISIDFLSETPINVTLEPVTIYETSSVGEFPFNYKAIGQGLVTTEIVNASHVRIYGGVITTPVSMEGNVTLGLFIEYWVHTTNQTLHGGWGDLFMLPVTLVPSILRPEGWFYANAATLIIGVILLIRYSIIRIQSS